MGANSEGYLFQACSNGAHDSCEIAQGLGGDICTCSCHDDIFAHELTEEELEAMERTAQR